MKALLRVDASLLIGTGHVMRCLSLAEFLAEGGWQVQFVCRSHPGNMIDQIIRKGFQVITLPFAGDIAPNPAMSLNDNYEEWLAVDHATECDQFTRVLRELNPLDLLVFDHYAFGSWLETEARPFAKKILVIDDLANRKHICDILIDQNFRSGPDNPYKSFVPPGCLCLLGPSYAILRKEFMGGLRTSSPAVNEPLKVLVFFGGVDKPNLSQRFLESLAILDSRTIDHFRFSLLVGRRHTAKSKLRTLASKYKNLKVLDETENMPSLMADHHYALGGGGTSSWERCCVGLPFSAVAIAENQIMICKELSKEGLCRYLGFHENLGREALASEIEWIHHNRNHINELRDRIRTLVDGHGVKRILNAITS